MEKKLSCHRRFEKSLATARNLSADFFDTVMLLASRVNNWLKRSLRPTKERSILDAEIARRVAEELLNEAFRPEFPITIVRNAVETVREEALLRVFPPIQEE